MICRDSISSLARLVAGYGNRLFLKIPRPLVGAKDNLFLKIPRPLAGEGKRRGGCYLFATAVTRG